MFLLVVESMEKYIFSQIVHAILLTFLARLVLNFKGIDYKTTWVEYPDIEATLSPQSVNHISISHH